MKKTKKLTAIISMATVAVMAAGIGATSLATVVSAATGSTGYLSAYDSFEDVLHEGEKVNEQIAAESFVLLKNKDNALPLASDERSITLLGAESYQTTVGGGGSGTTNRPGSGRYSWISATNSTIISSLNEEGFTINPRIANRYGNGASSNGDRNTYMVVTDGSGVVSFGGKQYNVAGDNFLAGADDNIYRYGDAAIINLSRSGSEGTDNLSHGVAGHADENEHYFTLNDSERQILAYAKYQKALGNVKKIIVLVNSPSAMELGDIEDDDAFDAMLWIGVTGWNGADPIVKVLTGEITPSGHTVDFWSRSTKTDPSWYTFGDYSQAAWELLGKYLVEETEPGNNYGATYDFGMWSTGPKAPTMGHTELTELISETANTVVYSEGIFNGYRYYETVAADIGGEAGEAWYDSVTLYPFGYGLSYTTFTQEIVDMDGNLADKDGDITVSVKVTNTGRKYGKDVVQLYSTPEYFEGGIDKAAVNLVGFEKTSLLAPGRSEVVDVTIAVKDLASFDYNDANKNNNSGYELEAGSYILSVRGNSHDVYDSETLNAETLLTWDEDGDPDTPNNIFSQTDNEWEIFNTSASHWTESGIDHDLHRNALLNADKTAPATLTSLSWLLTEDNAFKDEAFAILSFRHDNGTWRDADNLMTVAEEDDYNNLWAKTAEDMAGLTQGAGTATNGLYDITIDEMIGLDYDAEEWDTFMNQLTWDEILGLVQAGSYSTAALNSVGKDRLSDQDGPAQLSGGWSWVCEVNIASTWNKDLAEEQGKVVGNETLWNSRVGWYGPAMNIHRSPISGRNFEYYSQDGVQGGLIAASVVKGATDAGARVYIKHSFLNDQETSRVNIVPFVNEQALRESYLKPFELSVKKGNANGMMMAFNTIGLMPSTNYAVAQQLFSNEWGYRGINVTDYWMGQDTTGWYGYNMVRGLCIPLGTVRGTTGVSGTWDAEAGVVMDDGMESYTQWYWARETAKRILYVYANSNGAQNGLLTAKAFKTVTTTTFDQHTAVDIDLVDIAYLNDVFGSAGYTVTVTGLPAGLAYNAQSGHITGTPTVAGNNQQVQVSVRGENGAAWAGVSTTLRLTINAAEQNPVLNEDFTLGEGFTEGSYTVQYNAAAGENLTVTVDSSKYLFEEATADHERNYNPDFTMPTAGGNPWMPSYSEEDLALLNDNVNLYNGDVTYTASGLPAGMNIDRTTGAITGTPTLPGRYIVTVNAQAARLTASAGWFGTTWNNNLTTFASTQICIVVTGHTATFDANGGQFGNRATSSQVAFNEETAYSALSSGIQAPTRGEYTFLGWATTANATTPNVQDTTAYTDDVTFYAVWQAPAVMMVDGELWVNGVNTHITAVELTQGLDGQDGQDGQDGKDGLDGIDGVGIESVEINENGELIITLTNGNVTNLGKVVGADGATGATGATGPAGPQGEKGETGAAGLNGSDGQNGQGGLGIGGILGIVGACLSLVAIVLLGGTLLVLIKKKENK